MLNFGITVCFANLYFPDIVGKDHIYRTANWLYGCHPYHNYSFVAVVGAARPKSVFYGNNRADFSFIPGNVAPGCCSAIRTTSRTSTTGLSYGDRTREQLPETHSMSSGDQRSRTR